MSLPSSPALQKLSNVLYGEEYTLYVTNLQGDGLVWLVDYLDKVHRHIVPPYSPFKPA